MHTICTIRRTRPYARTVRTYSTYAVHNTYSACVQYYNGFVAEDEIYSILFSRPLLVQDVGGDGDVHRHHPTG